MYCANCYLFPLHLYDQRFYKMPAILTVPAKKKKNVQECWCECESHLYPFQFCGADRHAGEPWSFSMPRPLPDFSWRKRPSRRWRNWTPLFEGGEAFKKQNLARLIAPFPRQRPIRVTCASEAIRVLWLGLWSSVLVWHGDDLQFPMYCWVGMYFWDWYAYGKSCNLVIT